MTRLKRIAAVLFLVGSGFIIKDATTGTFIVLSYGCLAVFRVKSTNTFSVVLVALLAMGVALACHSPQLAHSFAVYAFILMTVGVITAFFEQYRGTRSSLVKKSVVKK